MIIQSVLLQLLPVFAGIVTGGFTFFGVRRSSHRKKLALAQARQDEIDETQALLKDEDREYFATWDRILNIYNEPVKPTPTEAERHAAEDQAEYERRWKAEVAAREAGEFYDWGSSAPVGGSGQAKAVDPGVARQVKRNEEWLAEQNRKALASIPSHDDVGDPFPVVDLRPSYARQLDKLTLAQAEARAKIQDHVDAIAAMKSIMEDVIAVHRDGKAIIIPEATLEIGDYPLLTSDDIDEEIARLDQLRRRSEQLKNRSSVLVNLLDPVTKQPIAVPLSDAVCENGVWHMRELPGVEIELFDRMDDNLITSTRAEIYQREDGTWRAKNRADRWMNKYRITPRSTDS